MKKISKIIMCIMSTAVIVFLLSMPTIAGYSSWTQTTQEDFDAGIKTRIKTTADGTFRLEDGYWLETTTAHFDTGVTKDNINTANNELKLLDAPQESIDQQQTQRYTEYALSYDTAQSFKPSRDCIITKASVYLWNNYTTSINYTIRLKADNNNSPGTTLQTKVVTVPGKTYGWYDVDWTNQSVTEDTRYWIFMDAWGSGAWWSWGADNLYDRGNAWDAHYGHMTGIDLMFKIYEIHSSSGHFCSQEKDLVDEVAFGKFYESHLSGQSYTFKVRKYSGTSWSDWITVNNGTNIGDYLSAGSKIQYDIILTSNDGITNPKVYDVKIEYVKANGNLISQYHDCESQIAAWGNFVATHTLNGQAIDYAVRTSSYSAGLSDATWYEVVSGGLITAPVNRYVQWKATLATTDGTKSPVVHDVTIYWDPYPDAPTLAAPADDVWATDNMPLFEWDFNDDCPGAMQAGFRVVIDDVNTFTGINYDSGKQNSTTSQWQFPFIIPDGVWYWKCCTKNNYGLWGEYSDYSILKIDTTPPDVPVMDIEPPLTSGPENEVSWSAVADAGCGGPIQYYVQCSSDSGFAWVTKHSDGWITGTSWNFTGLSDGVTYYYHVRAQDALGNQGEYSSWVWSRQDNSIITGYYASPDPFSPNDDGLKDATTIYYTLSRDCTVKIKIYESDEILKITLIDGLSKFQGPNWVIWDGKDKDENIVSNGTYTYRITAEDEKHNIREEEGTVRVENLVTIESTMPKDNGYLVIGPEKEEKIKMTFNRHMSTPTIILENIQIIDEDEENVTGWKIVYVSSVTTTITELELDYCTEYTVKVSQDVTDILGNRLTNEESFSFTTLIPGGFEGPITVKHKAGKVTIKDPSTTFLGGSKGYYINLIEKDISSLSNYVKGTGRILKCYSVDGSGNPEDIDWLEKPVTISIPYPPETKDRKNLKLYFYNKEINRWELVKGSGYTGPDDGDYYVTGEVTRTNTEYCVRGFIAGSVIENYCNYPNPFKAGKEDTTIIYDLKEDAKVTISIYDLLGQLVRRIEIAKGTPERGVQGTNKVPWNGKNERGRVVANGGYYCVVEADTETGKHMKKARKIMVIK